MRVGIILLIVLIACEAKRQDVMVLPEQESVIDL